MTDRLAEQGALQYAVENLATAGTNPNRLGLAGYIHAAYTDYQTWAAANPGVNPNRLSARGRLYGYFYDNGDPDAVIKALFANNEQGVFFDPSDLSTMFQDSAGTTPVTADGQPVGLILDKSKGLVLGPEVLPDPSFDTGTGWGFNGVDTTISGGTLNIDGIGGAYANNILLPTKLYRVVVDVASITSGALELYDSSVVAASIETAGVHTFDLVKFNGVFIALYTKVGGAVATVNSVSVKELPGNHAIAPSDAARPQKTSTSSADWINYDEVDDVLNVSFTSSLGSSCTVCRSNVGAAPTILTAQTIGTSYADSTDHAGLIIINRALTTQETTDVTAWLLANGATA